MSIDRSLRIQSSLVRHRNVLTRAERVERLRSQDRFREDMSPIGLPKVSNVKPKATKKVKKAPGEAAAAEEEKK